MKQMFRVMLLFVLIMPVSGMASELTHMVFLWLKAPQDAQAVAAIVKVSRSFESILSVQAVMVHRAEPSDRSIVDDSFDLAVALTFADRAALDRYLKDPVHITAVEEVIRPRIRKIVVYDLVALPD